MTKLYLALECKHGWTVEHDVGQTYTCAGGLRLPVDVPRDLVAQIRNSEPPAYPLDKLLQMEES